MRGSFLPAQANDPASPARKATCSCSRVGTGRRRHRGCPSADPPDSCNKIQWSLSTPVSSRVKIAGAEPAPRSSVLKFDIAILFDRYLLERLHGSLQQTGLLGIGRFVALHVRSLLAGDALLLLADLAARQVLECRGRDVDGIDDVGIGCARADDCRDCKSNVYAKAHGPPQYGCFEATFCTVQLAVQVGASAALPCHASRRVPPTLPRFDAVSRSAPRREAPAPVVFAANRMMFRASRAAMIR